MPLKPTPPPSLPAVYLSTDLEPEFPSQTVEQDPKVTQRKDKRKFTRVDDTDIFMSEMKTLFLNFEKRQNEKHASLEASVAEIKLLNAALKESADFISKKYDDLMVDFNKLSTERTNHLAYIQVLEEKVEHLEKHQKASCLELRNLPLSPHESKQDLIKIVINTGKTLNVPIGESDIRDVYRLKTKSESNRPILINLTSTIMRSKIIHSLKTYNKSNQNNKFSTATLQLGGPVTPVYLSESLTVKAKRLHYLAREFSKTNAFKFCWTANGKVLIRKKEGATVYTINSELDLKNIKLCG